MEQQQVIFNHHVDDSLPSRVYNHSLTDAAEVNTYLGEGMDDRSISEQLGLFNYPGRVLGSTKPGDVLQLHPNLCEHWGWISEHYARCGISHAQEIIWDDNPFVMRDFPGHEPSVFLFGERAHQARPDIAWYETVKDMNSKNNFIRLCQELGIPTPPTWCFDCKTEVKEFSQFPFPIYLKIAVSVSGLGVVRCEDSESLFMQLSLIDEDMPFQIQENVDAFTFLNLQYRKNGKLERFTATEQVLKGNCHAGNSFPTLYQPWSMTDPIAEKMVASGMRGYFAFDVAVCKKGDGVEYFAIECNPRYNGSSYPTNIAKKLNANAWIAKKAHTSGNSFAGIELGDVEYNPKTKTGVVVVNWGCINESELGVLLIAPDAIGQQQLEDRLSKILQ